MRRRSFRRAAAITVVVAAAVLAADCCERTLTSRRIRQAYFPARALLPSGRDSSGNTFAAFPCRGSSDVQPTGFCPWGPAACLW